MNTNKTFAAVLAIMACVALCLRLYWVIKVGHVPVTGTYDQEGYVHLATRFQDPRHIFSYGGFYVTPGYPFFGGVLLWAQAHLGAHYPPRLVIGLVQAVLAVGVIVLAALLARRRTDSTSSGLMAAAIMGFWIGLIVASGSVMTEHLATPLIMVLIYLLSGTTEAPRCWWLLAATTGLLLGFIILTKPLYVPLVGVALIILMVRNISWRKVLAPLLALTCMMALLGPWMYYVNRQTGQPAIGTAFGLNLCFGNMPGSTVSWTDEAKAGYCRTDNYNDPGEDNRLRAKAIRWMANNPGEQPRLVRLRWKLLFEGDYGNFSPSYYPGLWENWTMPGTPEQWGAMNIRQWHWLKWLASLGLVAMFMGRHRRFASETLAYSFAMLLIAMISVGDPRYRDPITPLMAIWAAYLLTVAPLILGEKLYPLLQYYQKRPYPAYFDPIK